MFVLFELLELRFLFINAHFVRIYNPFYMKCTCLAAHATPPFTGDVHSDAHWHAAHLGVHADLRPANHSGECACGSPRAHTLRHGTGRADRHHRWLTNLCGGLLVPRYAGVPGRHGHLCGGPDAGVAGHAHAAAGRDLRAASWRAKRCADTVGGRSQHTRISRVLSQYCADAQGDKRVCAPDFQDFLLCVLHGNLFGLAVAVRADRVLLPGGVDRHLYDNTAVYVETVCVLFSGHNGGGQLGSNLRGAVVE